MLDTLIGRLFPFKKFIPQPDGQEQGDGDTPPPPPIKPGFFPGMTGDSRIGQGGEVPQTGDSPFYPNGVRRQPMDERMPDGSSMSDIVNRILSKPAAPGQQNAGNVAPSQADEPDVPGKPDEPDGASGQYGGLVNAINKLPAAGPGAFYPGMSQNPDQPPQPTDGYVDPKQAYEANGGGEYSTPNFYPGGKGVKPSTARQAAFEESYKNMTPEQKQDALLEDKAPVDHNFGLRLLKGAVRGFARGGLGGAAVGAAGEGFFPGMNRTMNAAEELPKVNQQVQVNRQRQSDQRAADREQAYADNLKADNQFNQDKLDAQQQSQGLNRLTKLRYFDPKNPAHQRLAKQAGLDPSELQGWDDRSPVTKQVAGVTYNLNRQTGQYEPTNLPKDETKAVTDYVVTMPNGEKRSYKVSQKEAANFSTQMSTLGAKIQAQKELQSSSQSFELKKQQIAAQLQKELSDHKDDQEKLKAEQDQTRRMAIQDRLDQRAKMITQLRNDLSGLLGNDNGNQ